MNNLLVPQLFAMIQYGTPTIRVINKDVNSFVRPKKSDFSQIFRVSIFVTHYRTFFLS
jgi:hypothetical protein